LPWLVSRLARSGAGDLAEEVALDALVAMSVAIGRGQVDRSRNLRGYLVAIAMNRLNDAWRSDARERARAARVASFDAADEPPGRDELDRVLERDESRVAVARLIADADPTTRRVIVAFLDLADLEGTRPSAEQVAAGANVSRKTVFAVLARMRKTLRHSQLMGDGS
jgi:RNA polymerase sigma factor (sigma-70 family)